MVNSKMFQQNQMDDIFQHGFYEEDQDFYSALPASLPNDDIWKKFELLPTPPLSPKRDNIPPELNLDLDDQFYMDIGELIKDLDGNNLSNTKITFPETPPSPNLQSKLIQDCMWSGSARTDHVEKKAEKSQNNGYELNTCVDPASVFPYPINSYLSETKIHSLGTETPSDSEEEIDVVNVETQKKQVQPTAPRKQTTVTVRTIRADDIKKEPGDVVQKTVTLRVKVDSPPDVHNYSLPHSHSVKRVRSLPISPADSPQPVKKFKRELSVPELKRVCQKLEASSHSRGGRSSNCSSSASSRNSSDSEESFEGKRTQHNVLERKRRNDLKYSFFSLRDIVPDLTKQERAPKVLILKRASEYIRTLSEEGSQLEAEKSALTMRHEQLKRSLAKLQSKHFY